VCLITIETSYSKGLFLRPAKEAIDIQVLETEVLETFDIPGDIVTKVTLETFNDFKGDKFDVVIFQKHGLNEASDISVEKPLS
jgi:hypothetical protein